MGLLFRFRRQPRGSSLLRISRCLRASAVDAYSYGFHVTLVEECCFDRSDISHKVNLFDLHHKYCDVMHIDEVVAHLDTMAVRKAG